MFFCLLDSSEYKSERDIKSVLDAQEIGYLHAHFNFAHDKSPEHATLFVFWLVVKRPSNMRVYLRDGSAQTILCAATLR